MDAERRRLEDTAEQFLELGKAAGITEVEPAT
jgi:hypothetical protein